MTDRKSKNYLVPGDRIVVFDNDGTLWSEQPLYFQFLFMLDQVKAAAPKHPEWKDDPAFQALMAHDRGARAKLGQRKKIFAFEKWRYDASASGHRVTDMNGLHLS